MSGCQNKISQPSKIVYQKKIEKKRRTGATKLGRDQKKPGIKKVAKKSVAKKSVDEKKSAKTSSKINNSSKISSQLNTDGLQKKQKQFAATKDKLSESANTSSPAEYRHKQAGRDEPSLEISEVSAIERFNDSKKDKIKKIELTPEVEKYCKKIDKKFARYKWGKSGCKNVNWNHVRDSFWGPL